MQDLTQEQQEDVFKAIEAARATGKICKGINEVTKAMERGKAKLVVFAKNADPKELVMHLPLLGKEKGISIVAVDKKEDLGAAAGIQKPTIAVAITKEGEAKKFMKSFGESPAPKKKESKEAEEEKAEEAKE